MSDPRPNRPKRYSTIADHAAKRARSDLSVFSPRQDAAYWQAAAIRIQQRREACVRDIATTDSTSASILNKVRARLDELWDEVDTLCQIMVSLDHVAPIPKPSDSVLDAIATSRRRFDIYCTQLAQLDDIIKSNPACKRRMTPTVKSVICRKLKAARALREAYSSIKRVTQRTSWIHRLRSAMQTAFCGLTGGRNLTLEGLTRSVHPHPGIWRPDESFFQLPRDIARLAFPLAVSPLIRYRRDAVTDLFNDLDWQTSYTAVIAPPGTGKSVNSFAYALGLPLIHEGRKALWIQTDRNRAFLVEKERVLVLAVRSTDQDTIKWLLESQGITDVFFDQFRELHHEKGIASATDWASETLDGDLEMMCEFGRGSTIACPRRLFILTSDGFQGKLDPVMRTVAMTPWSLGEYREALKNDDIRSRFLTLNGHLGEDEEAAIKCKFFYSGISARFFFDRSVNMIKQIVRNAIFQSLGWDGKLRGPAHPLLSYIECTGPEPSSEYVAEIIARYD